MPRAQIHRRDSFGNKIARAVVWLALLVVAAQPVAARPNRARLPDRQARPRKALTVERIYGSPSLSGALTEGLEWSPDGKLLSYFQRTGQGADARTSLWGLDVASGKRRILLDFEKLRALLPAAPSGSAGQQTGLGRLIPQHYFWAPGSDALLFTSQGHLYWFDLKTNTSKQLTSGEPVQDPKISPDGGWVSFVRQYDLWVVRVADGQETRLTRGGGEEVMNGQLDWVYPEELDLRTAYWWSPDSSQIAYLQMDERPVTKYPLVNFLSPTAPVETMRYPKAGEANPVVRVGVVAPQGGETRWMETGGDSSVYIARVNWLRDSRRLAIERLNRAQTQLELLLADSSSGSTRAILTERDPSWINVHDDLYFLSDDRRFLWSSERDGFCHLYLYDLNGKLLKQLTRGSWEMAQVAGVDEREGTVYFLATQKSPVERHLYKLRLADGIITRMTHEDGSHSIRIAPDARFFVDTHSSAMTPPREDLYHADGTFALAINENKVAELAEYGLQPVEFLAVRGADGTELNAMMIKPPDFDPARRYPVLIYTYGGPHAQIVRNAWSGATFLWHQMMAQNGYIIFGLDNRGSGGRGHAFESYLRGRFGETELADQLAGVDYLKSLPYVDGSRIGIWGWSYGGYMTCYAMTRAPETFKAGFAGAPVTDWRQYDTIYTERYPGRPQDNQEGYKNSSPVSDVAELRGKLLVAHGTSDDNVHFANSVELSEALIQARRNAEILIYPGRGHGITDTAARVHLFRRVTQFFLENLGHATAGDGSVTNGPVAPASSR